MEDVDEFRSDSAFVRNRRLYSFISEGRIGLEVLEELLPSGEPIRYERQMWDYKLELPALPSNRKPTDREKEQYAVKMSEIVKDAVAFFNAYGGYLVIGVKDKTWEVQGFNGSFDCDELNKKIRSVTRCEVECHFALHQIPRLKKKIGLLFFPQRPDGVPPAQFLRDAPVLQGGQKAFSRNEIYFRQADSCRPAEFSEDFSFLCAQGRRSFPGLAGTFNVKVLDNNLGPRDPDFVRFIGRDEYIQELWRWLCDPFNPAKLLAGLGGVGKTTIARGFAEDLIRNPPIGFERVVWLSAKKQFYTAISGRYVPATRVDFSDVDSLLRALLLELGSTEDMVDQGWVREELVNEVVDTLLVLPSFVVIDDVDSLEPEQQSEVFHTILHIMNRTIGTAPIASRCLLTARLELGAGPGQLRRVRGLKLVEFSDYVEMMAKNMNVPWSAGSKQMKRFHEVTDGSPIFASSILRLLDLGESLAGALDKWKGSDGEDVRKFAFERELSRLTDSQIRTLYAACILGETSLLELGQITHSGETLLQDDLGELRNFHLLALAGEIPAGGVRLVVPSGIRLMADIIKQRVRDPKRIEAECVKARRGEPKLGLEVGMVVHRVLALWRDDKPREALELVVHGDKKIPNNPDLKCLLGRAYLRLDPPDARRADAAFRVAHDLGCQRTELFNLWLSAKSDLKDWIGISDLAKLAPPDALLDADRIYLRGRALRELGEVSRSVGNLEAAATYFLDAGRVVDEGFSNKQAWGRIEELRAMREEAFEDYVAITAQLRSLPDEQLEVWLATLDAFDSYVRRFPLVRFGVERLENWWRAVESRKRFDQKAIRVMHSQLDRLDNVIGTISRYGDPHPVSLRFLSAKSELLRSRWEAYRTMAEKLE